MVRNNPGEAQKPGNAMQRQDEITQVHCKALNSARRAEKKVSVSVPQFHCKELKSSAVSTASADDGGYESKNRSAMPENFQATFQNIEYIDLSAINKCDTQKY
jgi:hypothetical protein